MKKYNTLDLFSGAGGFSLGFLKNGAFNIRLSIDNNPKLSLLFDQGWISFKNEWWKRGESNPCPKITPQRPLHV